MRHWSQLGIRNWRVRPGRTAGAVAAIALGVGVVVWVTCAYESVRLALKDQVWFWIGRSDLSIESVYGSVGTVYQSLADEVKPLPNVKHVTCRLNHRMVASPLSAPAGATRPVEQPGEAVQVVGIDPRTEYLFRDYDAGRVGVGGRSLKPGDTDAALVEEQLARKLNLALGDRFVLRTRPLAVGDADAREKSAAFTVVGIIEHRRIAQQQLPVVVAMLEPVQSLARFGDERQRVTQIDMILNDLSPQPLRTTEQAVRSIVDRHPGQGFLVTSAEAERRQVKEAERQTALVLALFSSVALFTGFFIILSTLSMGMVERIGQLGMLRCLGATRLQIAALVLSEAVPLGLVGMVLGIPIGFGLAAMSVMIAPEYIGQFAVNRTGLLLALVGGAVTTLAGAGLPVIQAMRVSPLAASRPQSQPPPAALTWVAAVLGVAMIVGHSVMVRYLPPPRWLNPVNSVAAVSLLYAGYAMITPGLIRLVGRVAVVLAAGLLRVRHQLLSDQVGRATWRSAAICCGLMVGLSLIVALVVHSSSLSKGWDFPRDIAEAFVFITPPVSRDRAGEIQSMPGIASSCVINEGLRCTVYGKGFFNFPFSTFVAGDPDGFFEMVNLEFVEGNKEEAIAKLKKGGYILVTPEFTRAQKLTYKDKVPIKLKDRAGSPVHFEIAGVVASPALNIAANYFNAGGMLVQQSVFVVMGTLADARRVFGIPEQVSMFLINFGLPAGPPPPAFEADTPPPLHDPAALAAMIATWRPSLPERAAELDWIQQQVGDAEAGGATLLWSDAPMLRLFREALAGSVSSPWPRLSPEQRWRTFREELVMRLVAAYSGSSGDLHASVRALKDQIDRDLRRATILFASVPMVALIIAALGVGNLMMANVTSRARQIAMLRAIGATKWQVTRLIIGEALVLGCLGSLVGMALGLHGAASMSTMTTTIWGYKPEWTIPWHWVGLGVGFTLLVCLVAGVLPARRAARGNIIEALQTT